jgi:hypothetical protein
MSEYGSLDDRAANAAVACASGESIRFQQRLNRRVSEAIDASGKRLHHLERETGICRTQLSKIRNHKRQSLY